MIYLHCLSINESKFFQFTLFLLIIRAEATLIYKAVIVTNFINQAGTMIIRSIETMQVNQLLVFTSCEII